MDDKKLRSIIEYFNEVGMTQMEWDKVKRSVDICFNIEAHNIIKNLKFPGPDKVVEEYKREFDFSTPQQSG